MLARLKVVHLALREIFLLSSIEEGLLWKYTQIVRKGGEVSPCFFYLLGKAHKVKNKVTAIIRTSYHRALSFFNKATPCLCVIVVVLLSFFVALVKCYGLTERLVTNNKRKIIDSAGWRGSWTFYDRLCRGYVLLMTYENAIVLSWLQDIATELQKNIDATERDVIFYPFHVFSDEFPIVALALATKRKLSVISDASKETWSSKWGQEASQFRANWIGDLNLYNPFELSEYDAAKNIRKIISENKKNLCDFALFPDALPEYTVRLRGAHTYKEATIFKRSALLHSGGFTFPRLMKKDVFSYYIYVESFKLKLMVLPLIEKAEIGDKLPLLIERVVKEKSEQWMLWHFPSFYYFNG